MVLAIRNLPKSCEFRTESYGVPSAFKESGGFCPWIEDQRFIDNGHGCEANAVGVAKAVTPDELQFKGDWVAGVAIVQQERMICPYGLIQFIAM